MESNHQPYQLKRLHYFSGRMLSADDLEIEQRYFRDKLKRHNRFLHGSGVVSGLEVASDENFIIVSAGMALDCTGEEIVIPSTVKIAAPEVNHVAFLMIRYAEEQIGPAPTMPQPGQEGQGAQALYIAESFELSYEYDDPYLGHGEDPLLWIPCGKSHAIPLAKLFQRRDTWDVDPWFQAPTIA